MNSGLSFAPEELSEINLEVEQRQIDLIDPKRLRRRRAIPLVIALATRAITAAAIFLRGD
jgi:hypothetical protein